MTDAIIQERIERIARAIAARKCGISDLTGSRLPDDIWRQAIPDARARIERTDEIDAATARIAELERQRDDLHAANNALLERARAAEARADELQRRRDFLASVAEQVIAEKSKATEEAVKDGLRIVELERGFEIATRRGCDHCAEDIREARKIKGRANV